MRKKSRKKKTFLLLKIFVHVKAWSGSRSVQQQWNISGVAETPVALKAAT